MYAVYLSPLYILFHVHVTIWLFKWLKACNEKLGKKPVRIVIGVIYWILSMCIVIGFFMPAGTEIERIFKGIGNYWLGVSLYMAFGILIADLVRGLLLLTKNPEKKAKIHSRKMFVIGGSIVTAFIVIMCVWGIINAKIVRTTSYEVTIEKSADVEDMRIALVSDIHLGYNIGCAQMQRMVDVINAADVDVVVIAGDFFDNEYDALENPDELVSIFRQIKSKYGMYAVYGNHDIAEKILAGFTFDSGNDVKESDPRMDKFVEDCGIVNLRDEGVMIEGVYFYGRPDSQKPGRGIDTRKSVTQIVTEAPQGVPIITIDHQPRELHEKAAAGIDMDLGGHTHDGQLFPLNLTSRIIWENSAGYINIDSKMHSIVTSGVGLFGPNMRVATKSEVAVIDVHFTGK